eukprot:9492971-Pyramimonas_sp.AAC.1
MASCCAPPLQSTRQLLARLDLPAGGACAGAAAKGERRGRRRRTRPGGLPRSTCAWPRWAARASTNSSSDADAARDTPDF